VSSSSTRIEVNEMVGEPLTSISISYFRSDLIILRSIKFSFFKTFSFPHESNTHHSLAGLALYLLSIRSKFKERFRAKLFLKDIISHASPVRRFSARISHAVLECFADDRWLKFQWLEFKESSRSFFWFFKSPPFWPDAEKFHPHWVTFPQIFFSRNKLKINKSITQTKTAFKSLLSIFRRNASREDSSISNWGWTRKSESKVMVHSCSRYTVLTKRWGKTPRRMFKFIKEKLSAERD
jgi:hypothetical protein